MQFYSFHVILGIMRRLKRLCFCIHIYSQVLEYPHTLLQKAVKKARNSHHTLLRGKRFALEFPNFSTQKCYLLALLRISLQHRNNQNFHRL